MPKGAGASGKPIAVVDKPELGLTLINRLNDDQQRSFDWMHRPFAEAVQPFENLPPSATARLEKAKAAWDTIDFVKVTEDKQVLHVVRLVTSAGDCRFLLAAKYVPNHARSFLALARSGAFNGQPLVLAGTRAALGSPSEPELYSLERPDRTRIPPTTGSIAVLPSQREGQDSGSNFVVFLSQPPPPDRKSTPITVIGARIQDESAVNLDKIYEALKKAPDSVRIERVEIEEQSSNLFGPTGPSLPVVSPEGKLISPDSSGP